MENNCLPIYLVCEFLENPLGLNELIPRLSWRLADERKGAKQTAYRIVAGTNLESLDSKPDLWNTNWVKSNNQLDIEWGGKPLKSKMKIYWKVQVKDLKGKESVWSEVATFEMGLLKKSDWSALWISDNQERPYASPYFRKYFQLASRPIKARLYITSLGLFEASINGKKVGNDFFTPGWTDYNNRIHYMTYDVTDVLTQGENTIGVVLGDGWFAGNLGWHGGRNIWGNKLSLLAELLITLEDGAEVKIYTNEDWRYQYGAIRYSDIYNGETVDLRTTLHAWDTPHYDDNFWYLAQVVSTPKATLLAKPGYPVRSQEILAAINLTEPQFGIHIFDLGQNMVGYARIKLVGQHYGDTVIVRYAEMLKADGTLYTENLRSAKCTDTIYCDGNNEIWFEPKFTFHGFRYVEITGLRRKPEITDVIGVVLHSEMPSIGTFECSEPLVNQLQSNILWGQKGNFFETPTDCPQRNERLGWTGDAQVFAGTATFNRDVASFFEKYSEDMADAQFKDGRPAHVAPNPFLNDEGDSAGGQAAWADAIIICPWVSYLNYRNKRILEKNYSSMQKFMEWRIQTASQFIHNKAIFGDWLAIDIPGNKCADSPTPKDLIATAYFAHTSELFSKISKVLGKKAEEKKYLQLFQNIKEAFQKEFITERGRIVGDTQTAYLLALSFNLVPKNLIQKVSENLITALKIKKWHLSTGFVGTPLLAPVLTQIGRIDLAYQLLLNKTYPSWLYTVLQGATTMWERWNSYTKEKGFGEASMNSFNHYAYGAIGEWMVSTVAGLRNDQDEPGYKHILFKPEIGEGITSAQASLLTRYGKASIAWVLADNHIKISVHVPPNTTATVYLPNSETPIECIAGSSEFVQTLKSPEILQEKKSKKNHEREKIKKKSNKISKSTKKDK